MISWKEFNWVYEARNNPKTNKNMYSVFCIHPKSGSIGYNDENNSFQSNREEAFVRCIENPIFDDWINNEYKNYRVSKKIHKSDLLNDDTRVYDLEIDV